MNNKNSAFIKGVGAGVVTGAIIAVAAKSVMNSNKKGISKTVGKAAKAMGNIADMFR